MKKLFVSFTSLLAAITHGTVNADDLKNGLFFFGCRREHAFHPGASGETDERTWQKGRYAAAHPVIVDALLVAEAEGRASWHNMAVRKDSPWNLLDGLLTRNGFPPLQPLSDLSCHYGYPNVKETVAERGLPLEVLY